MKLKITSFMFSAMLLLGLGSTSLMADDSKASKCGGEKKEVVEKCGTAKCGGEKKAPATKCGGEKSKEASKCGGEKKEAAKSPAKCG